MVSIIAPEALLRPNGIDWGGADFRVRKDDGTKKLHCPHGLDLGLGRSRGHHDILRDIVIAAAEHFRILIGGSWDLDFLNHLLSTENNLVMKNFGSLP